MLFDKLQEVFVSIRKNPKKNSIRVYEILMEQALQIDLEGQ